MAMEVLVANIRLNDGMSGILLGDREIKTSAFVYGLLICMAKPWYTFPSLTGLLAGMTEVSGIRVNAGKTMILPLCEAELFMGPVGRPFKHQNSNQIFGDQFLPESSPTVSAEFIPYS